MVAWVVAVDAWLVAVVAELAALVADVDAPDAEDAAAVAELAALVAEVAAFVSGACQADPFQTLILLADVLKYPIKTLSELEFKFYSPSRSLYEFNGLDHSFTLEFYQEVTDIKGSNINVKSGLASEFTNSNNKTSNDEKPLDIDEYRDV